MNTQQCLIILGFLASDIAIVESSETIEIKLGRDWYYYMCDDSFIRIDAPCWKDVKIEPFAHAPKVPEGFTSRTEYTLRGLSFEPREFWKKPMDEQLVHLKDAILGCDLLTVVDKQYDPLYSVSYSHAPDGEPYPEEFETKFEETVWRILHKKYGISLEDFTASIRSMLIPEDKLYSAPLIVYFANKLAPRYEFHYSAFNHNLNKVIKLPSEFEVLIGNPGKSEVIYNRFK